MTRRNMLLILPQLNNWKAFGERIPSPRLSKNKGEKVRIEYFSFFRYLDSLTFDNPSIAIGIMLISPVLLKLLKNCIPIIADPAPDQDHMTGDKPSLYETSEDSAPIWPKLQVCGSTC